MHFLVNISSTSLPFFWYYVNLYLTGMSNKNCMTIIFPLSPVPTISVHPKNVSVYLVGNITEISFSCKATGIPKPLIGWLKNNSTKSNGTVIQTGSISVLILPLKEKEKAPGKYSCIATNSIGQAYSKEGTLEILTRRSLPIPGANSVCL